LAAAIERAFGIRSTLIKGGGGIYKITVNDSVIHPPPGKGYAPYPSDEEVCQAIHDKFQIPFVGK
jgi:hypothetical protein